ncbi:MAG: TRL-like family protein [Leptospirales bacterium]|nr:TRL-like family protein [Leptospirales bacterium]
MPNLRALPFLFSVSLLAGCVNSAEIPNTSLIYNNFHLDGEFNRNNSAQPVVRARGCLKMIGIFVAWGDAGAGHIASENGIRRIARIDFSYFSVLGVYHAYCTDVYGEK